MEIEAGSELSGLRFEVLDESRVPINTSTEWFEAKNAKVFASWVPKTRKHSIISDDSLPNIQVATTVGEITLELRLELSGISFQCSLSLHIIPSTPHSWKLKTSDDWDNGVALCDEGGLNSKLFGVEIVG